MSEKITLKTDFGSLNTLESKGQWLGLRFAQIQRADRKVITDFDLPLGRLLMALRAENPDSKQLPKARLQDCGIANVAKQRRSEAEFLARNWENPVMQELVASKRPVVKTAEQLVEELFKGMEKFDISQADLQAALMAKLAPKAADENTQQEAA